MNHLILMLPIMTMATSYNIILQLPKEKMFTRSTASISNKTMTTESETVLNTTRSSVKRTSETPARLSTRSILNQTPVHATQKLQKTTIQEKVDLSTPTMKHTSPSITASTKQPSLRCFDQYMNCEGVKYLCKNPAYNKIMLQSCAKTCSLCKDFVRLPIEERCIDKYPDECPTWAENGFCRSTFYTFKEKIEQCIKTCKLC